MLVSEKCSWHNQALASQKSLWGAGNCCGSQEKVCEGHELTSTKLWYIDSLHLVFPSILAIEWKSHLIWRIFGWNWIALNLQCARARVNSRGLVAWVLIVLDFVSECAILKPSGKIKTTQAASFSCSLWVVEETLGEIIRWITLYWKTAITTAMLIKECNKVSVLPTKEYLYWPLDKPRHFLKTVPGVVSQPKAEWQLAPCWAMWCMGKQRQRVRDAPSLTPPPAGKQWENRQNLVECDRALKQLRGP